MWTNFLNEFPISRNWSYTPETEAEVFRFSVVSGDFGTSGIGQYEVGQFDADGSGYFLRRYRTEPFGLIVQCKTPVLFETHRLGFRVPFGFNPLVLKVEVNDMPISTPGDNSPQSSSVVSTTVAASTTAGVLITANPNRKGLTIQNASTGILYIDFDGNVTPTSFLARLASQAYFEAPINYTGAVHGVWTNTNGAAEIREYV
jgi:hypothetical protein